MNTIKIGELKARVEALEKRVRTLEAMFNSLSAVSALSADAGQKLLIVNSPSPKGSLPSRAACAGSTLPSEQCFATACPPGQKAHPCGRNSFPETQWTLPLGQGHSKPSGLQWLRKIARPKGEGVDYPTRGVDKTRFCGLNEKAWELMEKARKGGLLDEEYRPTGSRTEAALLASAIAQDAGMVNKWVAFEKLWKIKYLRMSLNKATCLKKYYTIIKRINTILSTEFIQNTE